MGENDHYNYAMKMFTAWEHGQEGNGARWMELKT